MKSWNVVHNLKRKAPSHPLKSSLVGGQFSFDHKDRKKSREIAPLLSSNETITQYKSLWQFQNAKSEVELILVHVAMFTTEFVYNDYYFVHHLGHPLVLAGKG